MKLCLIGLLLFYTVIAGQKSIRTNFASSELGSSVIEAPSRVLNAGGMLAKNKDRYTSFIFTEPFSLVIRLTEDVVIEAVGLANYEMLSSSVANISLSVAQDYTEDMIWTELGEFQLPTTPETELPVPAAPAARYIRLAVNSVSDGAAVTTVSSFRVYGQTSLERLESRLRGGQERPWRAPTVMPLTPAVPDVDAPGALLESIADHILELGDASNGLEEALNEQRALTYALQRLFVEEVGALRQTIDADREAHKAELEKYKDIVALLDGNIGVMQRRAATQDAAIAVGGSIICVVILILIMLNVALLGRLRTLERRVLNSVSTPALGQLVAAESPAADSVPPPNLNASPPKVRHLTSLSSEGAELRAAAGVRLPRSTTRSPPPTRARRK